MRTGFIIRCVASLALGVGVTGCAAVFKGGSQSVVFESTPPGATVESGGRYVGDTPVRAAVDRLGNSTIKVSRPGYSASYGTMRRRPDTGWFVADILTCAIPVLLCIPLLVDSLSGSLLDVDETYRVKLEPLSAPGEAAPTGSPPAADANQSHAF